MSCIRYTRRLLSNIHQRSLPLKRPTRKYFNTANHVTTHRTLKLCGILVGGTTIFGFGYVIFSSDDGQQKKKLVILGSGWGAVSLIKSLTPGEFDISVISPENYFLFTPLLPSVTVGTLEGRSITEPIRKILRKRHKADAKFYEAECTQVNIAENNVVCSDLSEIVGERQEFSIDYDYLVVAVGAQTATYNISGVKEHTHYLKTIKQAQAVRKNIIDSFETAALHGQSDKEKERLLHFVIVGGGPSGVEFAAELRDFIRDDLVKYYPEEVISKARITLVDGLNKILNTYSEEISRYAEEKFKSDGIDIITNAFVSSIEKDVIHYKDAKTKEMHDIPYGLCVWCAGIAPRELTKQMQKDIPGQTNRFALITDHFMKVKNSTNIFSIGDCSSVQFQKFNEYVADLLDDTGVAKDAPINDELLQSIVEAGMRKFPQFCHQFKEMEGSYAKIEKVDDAVFLREDLLNLAQKVDNKQTNLPPTAQVAAQEGKFLGKLLSKHAEHVCNVTKQCDDITAFKFNYMGSFAYVGDNKAVLELPVVGTFKGLTTMWLWRGIYASECVSIRMRSLVLFDWIKSYIFGRDTSRL